MFSTYCVVLVNGKKHRHFIGAFETQEEAKHAATCATFGHADYAIVKCFNGGTIFYLKPPDPAVFYGEGPLSSSDREIEPPFE